MSRPVVLVLLAVSLFFLAFPLTLGKPGLPLTLKADEPAYYLMALSLAHDRDLRAEVRDFDRLFQEFPYRPVRNLILMSDDGWQTAFFGKPYVYALAAAPFAGLFGANGMLFFNLLLTLGIVWLGADYLARWNDGWLAALFAAGSVFLSAGFAYAFWLQPEVFSMAAVAAALYLGWRDFGAAGRRLDALAALSGAALMPAVYNKPMAAALALPLLWSFFRRRRLAALAWLAGAAAALGLVAGLAIALTGHATPYLGVTRQGVEVCEPGRMPIEPVAPSVLPPGEKGVVTTPERPTGGAWSWVFQRPSVDWALLLRNTVYFLAGRHTGLLLYFPFAVLALWSFLRHREERRMERALLVLALAGVALFTLVFISHNWQGGGGFIGNRYYVVVVPAFLFLATRVSWASAALGFALGGLFLGPILLTPFGPVGPEPTLQAHVRNAPFPLFPLELTLREVPGYLRVPAPGGTILGRRDVLLPQGEELWTRGADEVELWWMGPEPLASLVVEVRSPAPGNRIELDLEGARETVELGAGETPGDVQRVTLVPRGTGRRVPRPGGVLHAYRLRVDSETGRIRRWIRRAPPTSCGYFAESPETQEDFFAGAALTLLGPAETLARDVYAVRWRSCAAPAAVGAGSAFEVPVVLVNASGAAWPAGEGGARVRLAYHWRTPAGEVVEWEGERTDLPGPVAAGARVALRQRVVAPAAAGRYLLELEPVFEGVSWFSARTAEAGCRSPVEVVPAE